MHLVAPRPLYSFGDRTLGPVRLRMAQAAPPQIELPPGMQLPPGVQLPPGTQIVHGGAGPAPRGVMPPQSDDPVRNLLENGALVEVDVSVPAVVADALRAQGKPVPSPQRAIGLIDTGASISGVKPEIALGAQLVQTSSVTVSGVVGSQDRPIYAATISLPEYGLTLDAIDVAGVDLPQQNINFLIGRDVLEKMVLIYRGADGKFELQQAHGVNLGTLLGGLGVLGLAIFGMVKAGAFK